jgi:hypothetical protein
VPSGGARLALFVIAILVLGSAFAAVVRSASLHTPLGVAALLAIEVAAIAVAVGFHLVELPRRAPGTQRPDAARVEVDYF